MNTATRRQIGARNLDDLDVALAQAVETRNLLSRNGHRAQILTGASTGTYNIDPEVDGLTEELTAVLVLALLTTCPPVKVPLLLAKLLSPL